MTEITPEALEALSKKATQGPEEYAAFVNALFDAYRTGQLIHAVPSETCPSSSDCGYCAEHGCPRAQPSEDEVEAVARAIMVMNGACFVRDWAIERRDNPHVALAWDQATAAIAALDAVRGKQ